MAFSDPQNIIDQLGLYPASVVADFGAGSGFYTFAAARAVGDKGRVYGVDVQKDLLAKLKNSAVQMRLGNIEVVWGNIEALGGTHLHDFSVDAVLLCNVLFQAEDKTAVVREVQRVLKSKGMVLVVDWSDSFGGMGPAAEHVFLETAARTLFEGEGFVFMRTIPAGDNHYGLVYAKK